MSNDQTGAARNNNFGSLRLLFAVLVIVSHSPELVDGNRSRELLTQAFGTMSFGELAVDGFFLISGYLITKSFVQSRSAIDYFIKRILRIYPGYIVSFWACVLLIAPFVGSGSSIGSIQGLTDAIRGTFFLLPPDAPGAFQGLPYPALNGSMWTVAYEFRCYIAAAMLGILGVYEPRRRMWLLGIVGIFIIINATDLLHDVHVAGASIIGAPNANVRFFAIFGVGALYYVFRDSINFTGLGALIAAIMLIGLMFSHLAAETALMILGGYLIFWCAFKVHVFSASRVDNKTDISYGLYLYAWPVQNVLIWHNRNIDPWLLCVVTLVLAGALAYASWKIIEKPCLNLFPQIAGAVRAARPVQAIARRIARHQTPHLPYFAPVRGKNGSEDSR